MEENIFSNEDQIESGETHNIENQDLDEATNEPRSLIERKGDYKKSEEIQNTFETLVDNETISPSGHVFEAGEGQPRADEPHKPANSHALEMGPEKQPPGWSQDPPLEYEANTEDWDTVLGREPELRADLSGITAVDSDGDDKNEATPINIPGPQATAENLGATPIPIPQPEDKSITGREAPVRGDLNQATKNEGSASKAEDQPEVRGDLDRATTGGEGSGKDEATPINLPGPQAAAEEGEDNEESTPDPPATPINIP